MKRLSNEELHEVRMLIQSPTTGFVGTIALVKLFENYQAQLCDEAGKVSDYRVRPGVGFPSEGS